ncbi:MAG: hypothetical protein ABJF89_10765 [Parasphingorhabdus sp.]|uniref:hypothetical protein n=1 Tax=Parasphingorhabdus sp. TaxID=2709688 RepID=UPI0032646121
MKRNRKDKWVSEIDKGMRQGFIFFNIIGIFFIAISIRDNDWDKFLLALAILAMGGLVYVFCWFISRIVDCIDSYIDS